MFSQLPQPTIFGHRGASAYAPENTLAAFELAYAHKADAVELDVNLCKDGHVIVFHDDSVDRLTDGHGPVSSFTLAELRLLDAGSHFSAAFRGERIPALAEVLTALRGKLFINIELKDFHSLTSPLVDKVAELLVAHGMQEQVLLSCFNALTLLRARRLLPHTPIALLALSGLGRKLSAAWVNALVGYQAFHPWHQDVDRALVQRVQARGRRVHVYTVNDADEMRRLAALQVNGIITNDPLLANQVLRPALTPQGAALP
ncbi:MAG: glycerophosphodiester phosphodiesterase family protein [Anaerolineales bacterium]|nr:glycerophosphodiester phosphodiesterase family protein [Anaerolineales bacterium]